MRSSRTIKCKKLIYLTSFVLALSLAPNVSAAVIEWDGGGTSLLWSDAANWDSDTVPTSGDGAIIDIVDANCLIDSSVNAECAILYISDDNKPCYFNMTGGTLTIGGNFRIAAPSDSNAVFTMSGGTVSTSNKGRLWIGYGSNAYGTLIITSGEMSVADKLECGKDPGGNGFIYMYGGTLNIDGYGSDDLEIGSYGTGTITMTGGVINVNDTIKLAQGNSSNTNGIGRLYLYGGTINASSLRNPEDGIYGTPQFDITEGTLILSGDDSEIVTQYISNGWLTAYGGLGRVVVTYDEVNDQTIVTGQMSDPELSWKPTPSNFSEIQWTPQGTIITWQPGEYAVSHDVYFGTDWDDVNDANNTPGVWSVYKGKQDPCSFDPGPLELGMTYYWRIDEVNENPWAPPGSPWKGPVWQFTVADYIVVDEFEDYNVTDKQIWAIWHDGFGYWDFDGVFHPGNGTGSGVGDEDNDNTYMEETIVNIGSTMSMPYFFDNNDPAKMKYSEAKMTLTSPRDWTANGVKSLSLWFYGDPGNTATERMYVAIANNNGTTGTVYYKDNDNINTNATLINTWTQWDIDLKDFQDQGVNLVDVNSIAIGFGTRGGTTPGSSGKMYFDDIRLYIPRCMPSRIKSVGDLDNDCDVDYEDIAIMAGDWLETDYVALGSDGVLMNFPTDNSQWGGGVLRLDGVDDWVDINDGDFSNFHNRTIAFWVNVQEFPELYPHIFSFQNAGDAPYRIYIRTRGTNAVRGRFVEDYFPEFVVDSNIWHHLAYVLRDTDDGKCTGEFYGDGVLVGELPGRPRHSGGAKGVNIGSFNDGASGFANAIYDDFRVYNNALSVDEIKYLAEVPGGVEPTADMLLYYNFNEVSGFTAKNSSTYAFDRPIPSAAELYGAEAPGSRSINFKDFTVLAETWLEELLWP